jgi:adenylate cyclase
MGDRRTKSKKLSEARPQGRALRGGPAPAAVPTPQMLRRLRGELLARLLCIDESCGCILEDELCQRMAAGNDPGVGDFVTIFREIRELCDKGRRFIRESLGKDRVAANGVCSMEVVNKIIHDFKNLIAGITYRCQLLCEENDERFSPFAGDIDDIQRQFATCMAAMDEARGLVPAEPIAPSNASDRPPAGKKDEPCRIEGGISPSVLSPEVGHILVVDDERESRDYLGRELKRCGHTVTLSEDGRQALEALERNCYSPGAGEIDLVLLDLWMREVNGVEVLEEMKKDYGLRSIPVVMVSASTDIQGMVQCICAGADDYLVKPFEPKLLQARVTSCLAKRKLQKRERVLGEQIRAAKERADNLLYNIFPYTVAEELITSGAVKPRGCDQVAVMFCDVVGFTAYCNQRSPEEVVAQLSELFSAYETAVHQCKVEKIKTIGDCIMITAGLLQRFDNPVLACLQCGVMMIDAARRCSAKWEVRTGIHIGPVVTGMAGNKLYAFDVWGDTVNTASRIERTADPGTISVSEPAWAQVYQYCKGKSLGVKPLKGKASMEVFRFEGFRDRS